MLDMTTAVSNASSSTVGTLLMAVASANMFILVSLLGARASTMLRRNIEASHSSAGIPGAVPSELRLQLFRLVMLVLSLAAGIKLVLTTKLADDLIAAWFVGQGFALQSVIGDIISGIVLRHNKAVVDLIQRRGDVKYQDATYTVIGADIVSVVLMHSGASGDNQLRNAKRIVGWSQLGTMLILHKTK